MIGVKPCLPRYNVSPRARRIPEIRHAAFASSPLAARPKGEKPSRSPCRFWKSPIDPPELFVILPTVPFAIQRFGSISNRETFSPNLVSIGGRGFYNHRPVLGRPTARSPVRAPAGPAQVRRLRHPYLLAWGPSHPPKAGNRPAPPAARPEPEKRKEKSRARPGPFRHRLGRPKCSPGPSRSPPVEGPRPRPPRPRRKPAPPAPARPRTRKLSMFRAWVSGRNSPPPAPRFGPPPLPTVPPQCPWKTH